MKTLFFFRFGLGWLLCAGPALLMAQASITHEETVTGSSITTTVTTSGNVTAVSGDLYLASISTRRLRDVTSVSGLGLSWSLVKSQCAGRGRTGVELWWAQGAPSGDGTVSATLSGSVSNAVIAVSRYSGVDPANPLGNSISGNTLGLDGGCDGGVDSDSFSFSFATTENGALAFVAAARRHKSLTPGAGFTERVDFQAGLDGDAAGVAVMDRLLASAGSLQLDGTFDATVDWAVVGIEIMPGTTGGDTTPPVVSGVGVIGITQTAAVVEWTTNEPATSQVDYGTSSGNLPFSTLLNPTLTTSHSQSLINLTAGTTYYYRVRSNDAAGNQTLSAQFTFQTASPGDVTPPVLSNIQASQISADSATITWSTNELSDSVVDYGQTTGYGGNVFNGSLTTGHTVALTGLSAEALYHYRVSSTDASGNTAFSGDLSFTTAAIQPPASGFWVQQTGTNHIYYNAGNVGVGTAQADSKLTVNGAIQLRTTDVPNTGDTLFIGHNAGGDYFFLTPYDYASAQQTPLVIWTAVGVGINTLNPDPDYQLSVNGKIRAKEIVVETGWSDFVFKEGYRLMPLEEVAGYIEANGHLPGIPSEWRVMEEGVSLGEMQSKLLQKIEELTLYLIELKKENQALKREIHTKAGGD